MHWPGDLLQLSHQGHIQTVSIVMNKHLLKLIFFSRFRYSDTACVGKEQCCLTAKQHLDTRERQGVGRRCHRIENIKIRYRSFDDI